MTQIAVHHSASPSLPLDNDEAVPLTDLKESDDDPKLHDLPVRTRLRRLFWTGLFQFDWATPSGPACSVLVGSSLLVMLLLPMLLFPSVDQSVESFSLKDIQGTPKTTLVLMGYSPRRIDNYQLLFETYGKMDSVLDRVLFLWNNLEEEPPTAPSNTRVEIKLLRQSRNSMNNRFGPDVTAHTRTDTVLMADDDILLSAALLHRLTQTYYSYPSESRSIVGVRDDMRVANPGYKYHCDASKNWLAQRNCYRMLFDPIHVSLFRKPNVVVGKTMLVGTEFLYRYQKDQVLQEYVDHTFHCEDIFMNALVLNATSALLPKVVVSYRRRQLRGADASNVRSGNFRVELDDSGGLSASPGGWLEGREECVRWARRHYCDSVWAGTCGG